MNELDERERERQEKNERKMISSKKLEFCMQKFILYNPSISRIVHFVDFAMTSLLKPLSGSV